MSVQIYSTTEDVLFATVNPTTGQTGSTYTLIEGSIVITDTRCTQTVLGVTSILADAFVYVVVDEGDSTKNGAIIATTSSVIVEIP